MRVKLLLIFLLFSLIIKAQKNLSCECPKSKYTVETTPDTIFNFTKNRAIALCGYKNKDTKPVTFSEFILAECGKDTIIHSWGAVQSCTINTQRDTLLKKKIKLPAASSGVSKRLE